MSAEAMAKPGTVARAIRTPRAAALAGIAFSGLFAIAVVLVQTAVPVAQRCAARLSRAA